jgi:hypothetical protein
MTRRNGVSDSAREAGVSLMKASRKVSICTQPANAAAGQGPSSNRSVIAQWYRSQSGDPVDGSHRNATLLLRDC